MEQINHNISDTSYNERKCVILLDEVSIMKAIEYNTNLDEIEGFEDQGSFDQINKLDSRALVLMVRGLYKNLNFSFSYYFTINFNCERSYRKTFGAWFTTHVYSV